MVAASKLFDPTVGISDSKKNLNQNHGDPQLHSSRCEIAVFYNYLLLIPYLACCDGGNLLLYTKLKSERARKDSRCGCICTVLGDEM